MTEYTRPATWEEHSNMPPEAGERVRKVMEHARRVLGSMAATHAWLRSPQRALGFRIPLELLATEHGAEAVQDLLGRIEYGVVT